MTAFKSLKIIFIIWFIPTIFATYAASPDSGSVGSLASWDILCPDDYTDITGDKDKIFYTFLTISVIFLPAIVITIMYTLAFLLLLINDRKCCEMVNWMKQALVKIKEVSYVKI